MHYSLNTWSLWIGIVSALVGTALCVPAAAQKMYRCGNVYQDRPCDNGQAAKVVSGNGGGSSLPDKPGADAACTQRGLDSQKIVWSREAGATAEKMLAQAKTSSEKTLVTDVYRRYGSAPQVRAAIEADCLADKEKAAQAAALLQAAARLCRLDFCFAYASR